MTIPFFDSNPALVNELREMDHDTRAYKKLLPKILLEIGGMAYLFNNLKTTDDGNYLRKNYFHNLIATSVMVIFLFIWIFAIAVFTGGKEINQFDNNDITFFVAFAMAEIASIALAMVFAFRGRRVLLNGVSYLIDNYSYTSDGASGNTLSNYKFVSAKMNKMTLSLGIISFVVVFGIIALSYGTMDHLFVSHTQEFSKAGMTITLTRDFIEKDVVSQTATYFSSKYTIMTLKEEFQTFEQNNFSTEISLKEYAEKIIANNSLDTTIEVSEDRPCFVYSRQVNGKNFTNLTTVFKGSDAFWMVTFACETKNFTSSREQFEKWADTIIVA